MKIRITRHTSDLQQAGFFMNEEYEINDRVGETLIASKLAERVKNAGPVPENKALNTAPQNKGR